MSRTCHRVRQDRKHHLRCRPKVCLQLGAFPSALTKDSLIQLLVSAEKPVQQVFYHGS